MKTIIVQGAMHTEIEQLLYTLPPANKVVHHGYVFYETAISNTRVIISQTEMGIMNASVCTMIAIQKYHPDLIINQGTAGAHLKELKVGDIIIGEEAVYINSTRSPAKCEGQGSNALEWRPSKSHSILIKADSNLLQRAKSIPYKGNLLQGRLGTGDIFSKEVDRIKLLHSQLGEVSEDMESIATYKACQAMDVPVIGIRVISNNEITGNSDVEDQFKVSQTLLQRFIFDYITDLANNGF